MNADQRDRKALQIIRQGVFRPLYEFEEHNKRNFSQIVAWVSLFASIPISIVGFAYAPEIWRQTMAVHFGLLVPMLSLCIVMTYKLPTEKIYYAFYFFTLTTVLCTLIMCNLGNQQLTIVFFPIVSLAMLPLIMMLYVFPKQTFWAMLSFIVMMNVGFFLFLYPKVQILSPWFIFNSISVSLMFLLAGLKLIFQELNASIGLQKRRVAELTETNALLNIAMNQNQFGLVGFDNKGALRLERGAPIERIFDETEKKKPIRSLNRLKVYLYEEFKVNFSQLDSQSHEIKSGDSHFILQGYNLRNLKILTHMDVTKIRFVEAELRAHQKRSLIGEFTSGIAHNYNNSLTVALANLEAYPNDINEMAYKEYIEPSILAIKQSADISHKLLALSGRFNLKIESFDLSKTIIEMEPLIKSAIGDKILLNVHAPESIYIMSDKSELESAVLNLALNAKNAIKYKNGKIDILVKEAESYVCLSISDNGHGVPEEIRDKIFDPFFSTKQTNQSAGLGLSTVKAFIQQSNGHIELNSIEGKTTFSLYFPNQILHEKSQQLSTIHKLNKEKKKPKKVLIIDDNPLVARSIERLLRKYQFDTKSFINPIEAISNEHILLETTHIIVDLSMPEMTGLEFGRRVKKDYPELKLFLLTGEAKPKEIQEALDMGFKQVLMKPVNIDVLIKHLESAT